MSGHNEAEILAMARAGVLTAAFLPEAQRALLDAGQPGEGEIGTEVAEMLKGRTDFLAEREALAERAYELILNSENDDDVESAILFAERAMHDDQAKLDMLDWCLWNCPGDAYLGFVLEIAWRRPKTGSLITAWGFDRESIEDAFSEAHSCYLMSDDADYELWRSLRRKRKPITIWRGVEDGEFEHAAQGFSWTTDRSQAEWFAKRGFTGKSPLVVEAQVSPKAIVAAWQYESEIIVLDYDPLIDPHEVPLESGSN